MYDNDLQGHFLYRRFLHADRLYRCAGWPIASLIGIASWTTMTGLPILEMDKALSNPSYSNFAKGVS